MSHRNPAARRHGGRRGAVIVYVAIILLGLIGVFGLSVDTGYVFLTSHQLQNAADAAALAGADQVAFDTVLAKTKAVNIAAVNKAAGANVVLDSAAGDVLVGNYNRGTAVFLANSAPYNAVQVTARRTGSSPGGPVNLIFASMFGIPTADVTRHSTAMYLPPTYPAIIVLDPSASGAFKMTGNATLTLDGAGIQVDSNNSTAMIVTGSGPTINASEIDVVGGTSLAGTINATVKTGATSEPDPLSALAAPAIGADLVGGKYNANQTFSPGYYSKGITMSSGATATLTSGTYILDGAGLKTSGSGTGVDASAGVLLYFTGRGTLDLTGTGPATIAPLTSGPYAGISVFQDRADTNGASSQGPDPLTFTGVLYFPSAQLLIGSNSHSFIGSQIIAQTLLLQSNSVMETPPGTRFGSPTMGTRVFLVR